MNMCIHGTIATGVENLRARVEHNMARGASEFCSEWKLADTGNNGFVAIMYLDDKSVVKMLGNSDLTVSGKRSGTQINKSLDIKYGKIAASISPQKGNEFRIATPTSVASVKGTELTIDSQPGIGDSFTLLEGLIEVTNTITGESTEVEIGETAVSTPEGSLEVHETTTDDIAGFELADIEIPTQEIRFEVEDEDANIKEIGFLSHFGITSAQNGGEIVPS